MNSEKSRMTSDSLILGIQAGNEDAWIRMTTLFGPHVYKCIVLLTRRRVQSQDIADISQEVFLAATQKIETYRHSRGKHGTFRGWLYGITRNKVLQHIDKQTKAPLLSEFLDEIAQWAPESLTDDLVGDGEIWKLKTGHTHQAIEIIRSKSEDHTWQAFWRTVIHGEKNEDVAEDLGMAGKAVRQARHRTIQRLQREIERLNNAENETPVTNE